MRISLIVLVFLVMISIASADWQPEILAQGMCVTREGICVGNGEVIPEAEFDYFLQEMKSSGIKIFELRIWDQDNTNLISWVIEAIHHEQMEVAINFWVNYPGVKLSSSIPQQFRAEALNDQGEIFFSQKSDGGAGIYAVDFGNPGAVIWLAENLAQWLEKIAEPDYLLFDEDKLNPWRNAGEWPKTIYYWDAPIYSQAALESWRKFYGDPEVRFPIHNFDMVRSNPERLIMTVPGSELWNKYFAWRTQLFTEYLKTMAQAAQKYLKKGVIFATWQRLIDECEFEGNSSWPRQYFSIVEDNIVFGVSFEEIAQDCPTIKTLIVKYVEDGCHPQEWTMADNEINTAIVNQIVQGYEKNLGTFVQLFNYDSETGSVELEVIEQEWQIAQSYRPQMVMMYDVASLYSKSERFDPKILKKWRQLVLNQG